MSTDKKPLDPQPDRKPSNDADACKQHLEDVLDEGLEDTFPASDPPSIISPHPRPC